MRISVILRICREKNLDVCRLSVQKSRENAEPAFRKVGKMSTQFAGGEAPERPQSPAASPASKGSQMVICLKEPMHWTGRPQKWNIFVKPCIFHVF